MAPSGILLVDKAGGMTSHDVVARARRALKTKKIGHAGTLDPMATGLLILGVGPATRLLTFIVGLDKTYEATIRLGVATDSDDADGEITGRRDASGVFVDCSSGTYIRALARDLGADLGVGGHLTALRRTHVGPFAVSDAQPVPDRDRLEDSDLAAHLRAAAEVAASVLGGVAVTAEQARDLRHGKRITLPDAPDRAAAIAPDGSLIGVVERRGQSVKSVMNMPEPENSPETPAP
jgi:tRNA pseudouridine55 synthase